MCHLLSYKFYPKFMVVAFLECGVKGLNTFPTDNLISSHMSPVMLVQAKSNPDFNQRRMIFFLTICVSHCYKEYHEM